MKIQKNITFISNIKNYKDFKKIQELIKKRK